MALIYEMAVEERPREKLRRLGAEQLSEVELIAILLRTGKQGRSVLDVARDVHQDVLGSNWGHSPRFEWRDFTSVSGIGVDKAVTLSAAIELGRRVEQYRYEAEHHDFSSPEAVANYFFPRLRDLAHEEVHSCLLNAKNILLRSTRISSGGINSSIVDVRMLMKEAIRWDAVNMIMVHNHPSGNPDPSREDIEITRRVAEAGRVLNIHLLDHIIIGNDIFVSLKRKGYV